MVRVGWLVVFSVEWGFSWKDSLGERQMVGSSSEIEVIEFWEIWGCEGRRALMFRPISSKDFWDGICFGDRFTDWERISLS